MTQLLLGCGASRIKKLWGEGGQEWQDLVTLDIEAGHNPDILFDLNHLPHWPIPLASGSCSEIHAYDVLEHFGRQGDYRRFFREWAEFYRLLAPGGLFFATCPRWDGPWAWGDPGHTRVLTPGSLTFLDQTAYRQIGLSPMTDYRAHWKGDFHLEATKEDLGPDTWGFILRAQKPARGQGGEGNG